jgi:hypothetical protein
MADIGHDGVVTNTTKQGGLAAAYYFGGMWGCFIGGTMPPSERERERADTRPTTRKRKFYQMCTKNALLQQDGLAIG